MIFPYFDWFIFDKPLYRFTRETKDCYPYRFVEKDGKYILVINALGIKKEDINIDVSASSDQTGQMLIIKGNTHNDILDTDYNIYMCFNTQRELESIDWDVQDGLLKLDLAFKEPEKPKVNITRK